MTAAAGAGAVVGAPRQIRADLAELLRLAGPVVAARVGVMTMGLTDALVVGRHSAVQLGYLALGWAFVSVVVVTAMGLLTGVQVMASRALGEGRPLEAGAALRRGLVYAVVLGVAASVVLVAVGPFLLHAGWTSRALADGATAPLLVLSVSLPFFALSVAAGSWLEGLGRPTPVTVMMWLANLMNLAVNLALVPGAFGLPALGAAGAAWATFASRGFLALASLVWILRMPDARALGVFRRPSRDRAREIEQRRIGYGAGASNFFEVSAFASMTVIAGSLGALTVAAYTVVLNVVSFVFMVPLGLATATAVLVARAYGARNRRVLERAAATGFGVTAVFGIMISLIIWPVSGAIAAGYTTDPTTIALAAAGLALGCIFLLPDAMQVVVAQALRARGDVLVPSLTHLTSYLLIMVPLGWTFAIALGWGLFGIVWAIIAASFASAGLLLGRFWMLARRD